MVKPTIRSISMSIRLLTVQQVCDLLQIAPRTLRRIVSERRLRPIKIRGSIRFSQAEVEQLIDGTVDETTARLPNSKELPRVVETAAVCLKSWNEAIHALQEVVSIWSN